MSAVDRDAEARALFSNPGVRAAAKTLARVWAGSGSDVDSLSARAQSVAAPGEHRSTPLRPEAQAAVSRLRSLLSPAQFVLLPELVVLAHLDRLRVQARLADAANAAEALETERRRRLAEAEVARARDEMLRAAELARRAEHERREKEYADRCRREAARQAAAVQERRQALLARVERSFEEAFLDADRRRAVDPDKTLITDAEYHARKVAFVRRWARMTISETLDPDQAAAVAASGGDIQVVARAGSGKTRTLVTRALFLQMHCGIEPSRLLLLAFNRKAKDEIRSRVAQHAGDELPHVLTFHALAHAVVHPREHLLYDDPELDHLGLRREVQQLVDEYVAAGGEVAVRALMLSHFREAWDGLADPAPAAASALEIATELDLRRSLQSEALDGTYVKSYGEKLIANALFEHGVEYRYEQGFRWGDSVYRPDFTIGAERGGGVIVEYLGLAGDPAYDAITDRKRKFWAGKPEWTLVELVPADIKRNGEDRFVELLLAQVARAGFEPRRRTDDELWSLIRSRTISRFGEAVSNFIGRCRAAGWSAPDLDAAIGDHGSTTDAESRFLDAATSVLSGYEAFLLTEQVEDFSGLVWRAVARIGDAETRFSYDAGRRRGDLRDVAHVLVDEFQDFSPAFYGLLTAIRQVNKAADVFAVGDDWQAINGFAGSDLRFFTEFASLFRQAQRIELPTNYRSARAIVATGNLLMGARGTPGIPSRPEPGTTALLNLDHFRPTAVEELCHGRDVTTPAILRLVAPQVAQGRRVEILMRTNRVPAGVPMDRHSEGRFRGLDRFATHLHSFLPEEARSLVSVSTAHRAKGLERAAVIVLGANASAYPKIHPTWPFFRIFGDTPWTLAEAERRLFYVALTRAEYFLAVVMSGSDPSPFVTQLSDLNGLSDMPWYALPPAPSVHLDHVEIRVFRAYEVRALLKQSGFKFVHDNHGKYWRLAAPIDEFSWDSIDHAGWNRGGVRVSVVDASGQAVTRSPPRRPDA